MPFCLWDFSVILEYQLYKTCMPWGIFANALTSQVNIALNGSKTQLCSLQLCKDTNLNFDLLILGSGTTCMRWLHSTSGDNVHMRHLPLSSYSKPGSYVLPAHAHWIHSHVVWNLALKLPGVKGWTGVSQSTSSGYVYKHSPHAGMWHIRGTTVFNGLTVAVTWGECEHLIMHIYTRCHA